MWGLINKYLGNVVRHWLTVIAGILMGYGMTQGQGDSFVSVNTEIIMGIITYVLGQGLSFLHTKKVE